MQDEIIPALPPSTSPLAVWSLFLGFLATAGFGFLAGIPAVYLGHMARCDATRYPDRFRGRHLAGAGLFLGYTATLFSAVVLALFVALMVSSLPGAGLECLARHLFF